jgi:hypothetical protein
VTRVTALETGKAELHDLPCSGWPGTAVCPEMVQCADSILVCWKSSGSVSNVFGLTRIWQKCCFSMTMQDHTQLWRLGKP